MKPVAFYTLMWLLVFVCKSDGKRTKPKWRERTLHEQCKKSKNSRLDSAQGPMNGPLQLQAFLDLNKGVVCFKVESCNRPPVCIVEANSKLKQRRLNECTLWNQFISILSQAPTRKIEPVITGENSKHTKHIRSWYQPRREWPDEIYSLCRRTIVYRFLGPSPQNSTNSTAQSSNGKPPVPIPDTPTIMARALSNAKNKRNIRGGRRRNNRARKFRLPSCDGDGFNIPCTRICVGQTKEQRSATGCSAFKIKCMFHRRSDGIAQPKVKSRNRGSHRGSHKKGRKPSRN